ncbi:MAG: DUF1631 family protein [Kangiellaceae bacterium]|nr:DUF1631 family protein [Kangiellaceae bacterium]
MSRKLRALLKQNRRLEEKIFYEPRSSDWRKELITHKELSDTLTCLANKIISSENCELSVLKMLNNVESVSGRPLAAFEKNALQVVEILFNYLRTQTEFDKRYYHILNSLQLSFTRLALDDLSFLDNPKHSAVTFLEKLLSIGYHFDANAGKLTQFFVHAIELLVDRMASKPVVTGQLFAQAHRRLDEYTQGYESKNTLATNKIISEVEKESRRLQADYYTSHLIKSKMEGDEIPIFLLDFFENQLSHVLHQIILSYGTQSKQCQQLLTDMDTISWSVSCPFEDPDYKTRFDADVNQTMKRVFEQFKSADLFNEYVQSFFLEIEELHRNKLDGKRVHLDVMISADIFSDDTYSDEDYDSWSPKQVETFKLDSLTEGSWYYLEIDGDKVRSKLLMINELTEELYFVNASSELLKTIGFDEQNYLTKNLEVFTLKEDVRFDSALEFLEDELAAKVNLLEAEFERFQQQALIDEKQEEQLKERARLAILRRLEIEKQQAEKERVLLLARKKQEQDSILAQEKIDAEKRFKAKGLLRKLGAGSKVAIMIEGERWTEASLMLISRTTQRYIFADAGGKKVLEPTKTELIEMLLKQTIKILQANNSKDDPLQSLVKQRRHKLSQKF